jgi:lipoprotein-anchoring transpeptidase ErfK/SrfK
VMDFPNALPRSRAYSADLRPDWRQTLSDLNVDANQPKGDRIVVDKSESTLRVYDGERLVALFTVTTGSSHDPLPIGTWKIQGADYNPKFHYNPELFWDVSDSKAKVLLPAGPNGPVGVVWLDLNKPHYGIHGTPEPQTIGRSESHGCIRLTNWDVARLSLMVKPGVRAEFKE